MIGTATKDEQHQVSDSTDWLETPLSGLAPLDAGLRCLVCKDFYNTPMITSCSHTFCSLCIRRCLATDGKCPACRTTEQENKLRSNWAIESVVNDFVKARPTILTHARALPGLSVENLQKRKIEETGLDGDATDTVRKRTRSSTRLQSEAQAQNDAAAQIDLIEGSDHESSDTANCPVCSTRMKIDLIDAHLNTCLNVFPAQTSANPNATAHRNIGQRSNISVQPKPYKPERLPRLSYSILKETALRKKLQELGIPSTGNRQMLERRHIEWVTLWNANCDASRPRKKPDLLRDLDTWERTQGMKASSLSGGADAGSQILNKDFDSAGWATTHDKSFQELIANARRSIRKDSKKSESSGEAPPVEGAEGDHPDEKRELPTPEESLRTEPDGDGWVDKYAPLGSRDPPDDHDPGNGDHDTFASDAMLLTSPAQSGGAENFHKYTNE